MLQVVWQKLSNEKALFQSRLVTLGKLKFVYLSHQLFILSEVDQDKTHRHFLTPEPLIPFCKVSDYFSNLPYHGIEGVFESGKYCSIFRDQSYKMFFPTCLLLPTQLFFEHL